MNIFQRIVSAIKQTSSKITTPFISTVLNNYSGELRIRQSKDYLKEYKNWTYACIKARAKAVANIKLELRKDGELLTEGHPVLDLIKKVNDGMTKNDLLYATQAYKDIDGNAYWYLAREDKNKDGEIKEIYLLRPDRMKINISKENPLKVGGYVYVLDDGQQIPFETQEILHFKSFDAMGNFPYPHKGQGIVQASAWAIDTDNEIRKWNYNFFKNSARPDGILISTAEGSIDADEYKRLKAQWREEHQGSDNAHKIAVLSGGIKWQPVSYNQTEMEFLAQREFTRDEILGMFNVPKTIIGLTDSINRATAEASIYVFSKNTVEPLMQEIVDTLNEFLLPEYNEDTLEFTFVSPTPEDRISIVAEYTAGLNNWLTRNEIRAKEGLSPTQNGDVFYEGANMVEIDRFVETPQPKKISKPTVKDFNKKSVAEKAIDSFFAKMPEALNPKHKQITIEQKDAYIAVWKNYLNENHAPLKKKLWAYFKRQEKIVIANLREEMKGLEAKEFVYKSIKDIIFDMGDEVKAGISLITPFIQNYIDQSGGQASQLVSSTFDSSNSRVADFIKSRANYFSENINQTTADALMSTIQEGMDNTETLAEISDRISNVYSEAEGFRADMIARTEVSASGNFGATEAYRQAGVEKRQWVVVNPCDECSQNEDEIVGIDDTFSTGDDDPPVHPNCECTTLPIFD